jgi:hypothetical protein
MGAMTMRFFRSSDLTEKERKRTSGEDATKISMVGGPYRYIWIPDFNGPFGATGSFRIDPCHG